MKRMYAPWRIDYIRQPKEEGCFLCAGLAGDDDRASLLVHRAPHTMVVLNRYPYNNGHLLIAPHRHVAGLDDLGAEEQVEIMGLAAYCTGALRELMRPEGFNLGFNLGLAAGAGLEDHLHLHVVPRWGGDTNFMSVLSDTRVIPEALDALWTDLFRRFAAEPPNIT
jgi:ATP adenylyltransferase